MPQHYRINQYEVYGPAQLVTGVKREKTQTRVWNELSHKLETIQPNIMSNVSLMKASSLSTPVSQRIWVGKDLHKSVVH